MFQVVWLEQALDELAAIWTKADSNQRKSISDAARAIDRLLERDPDNQGESRSAGQRILIQVPVAIRFEIRHQRGLVRVLHIWSVKQRGQP